jgi:enoyl-CoA hydratase/carnithine racemase
MAMPPARVGVLYSAAGIERFIRLAGPAVAKEMFFSARRISAARALSIGLLNSVVPRAELVPAVEALAKEITANAPRVIAATKAVVNELSFSAARLTILENRRDAWRRSDELTEGLRAIRDGKKPSFSDSRN